MTDPEYKDYLFIIHYSLFIIHFPLFIKHKKATHFEHNNNTRNGYFQSFSFLLNYIVCYSPNGFGFCSSFITFSSIFYYLNHNLFFLFHFIFLRRFCQQYIIHFAYISINLFPSSVLLLSIKYCLYNSLINESRKYIF